LNSVSASNVQPAEQRLVDAAAAGDREARRELFERYRTPAFHVAYRITGRREDALDVVQDSFIKAFQSLGSFQRDAGFKTWLLRIVANRALDLLRTRRVRLAASFDGDEGSGAAPSPAAAGEDDPGQRLEREEVGQRVAAAVEELPPAQRAVFSLYATGEMTYGQIAEALGVPIGTVMSRLYHARIKLKARLADLDPGGTVQGRNDARHGAGVQE
jgi:RNA polymerase sigma-70 factor (ECF subfamily)